MRSTLAAALAWSICIVAAFIDSNVNSTSLAFSEYSLLGANLPEGTCNGDTPCANAACCSTGGICGYSLAECGKGNCTSNCDAKAQCGPYAEEGSQRCPLNVCCSKFGWCGSTSEFCDSGCQKGYGSCGNVKRPKCSSNNGYFKRQIGYYESWANFRGCQKVSPNDLDLTGYTHINFAFALFDEVLETGAFGSKTMSFKIAPMGSHSEELYSEFTALKNGRQGLQTWISIGGWAFSDPGPTRYAWTNMVQGRSTRANFIDNLIRFMETYGFDGVDLDWEYPQAADRDGHYTDTENYVALVREMRHAFGSRFGISVTLPASYWYLQHFDVYSMERYVDWFNLMSYDMHGVWDKYSRNIGPYIAPHTNITEIDLGLDLLWRAGIDPHKVVMGLGLYGRSFKLADTSCNVPNGICEFIYENGVGADPGGCSDASGILNLAGINDIIETGDLRKHLVFDKKAAVKWMTFNTDQWVSFDDAETLELKRSFAMSRCLGGTMVWAMDQVDQEKDSEIAQPVTLNNDQRRVQEYLDRNYAAQSACFMSECGEKCPSGTNAIIEMSGSQSQVGTSLNECGKSPGRILCCSDGTTLGTCQWRGYSGLGMPCFSGCQIQETELIQSTRYRISKSSWEYDCAGNTYASYCCSGFSAPPGGFNSEVDSSQDNEEDDNDPIMANFGDQAKALAEAGAEQVGLDVAAKALCSLIVTGIEALLDEAELAVPILGEIAIGVETVAEVFANRYLIKLCSELIEKEGKAAIKAIENKLEPKRVTRKPSKTRPPKSSHTSAKTRTEDRCDNKRADNPNCKRRKKSVRTTTAISDELQGRTTRTITLDCGKYPQPCWHYSSVIRANPEYGHLTCIYGPVPNQKRRAVEDWYVEHDPNLVDTDIACQADEWPPAKYIQINDGSQYLEGYGNRILKDEKQFIRLLSGSQNTAAGQKFIRCPKAARSEDVQTEISLEAPKHGGNLYTEWTKVKAVFTREIHSVSFEHNADPGDGDDGLTINECAKLKGVGDKTNYPGFALLNRDPWFDTHQGEVKYQKLYEKTTDKRKRDFLLSPDEIVVVGSNSSRRPTAEELRNDFGLIRCEGDCGNEVAELEHVEHNLKVLRPSSLMPVPAVASATSISVSATHGVTAKGRISNFDSTHFPQQTQA
ncbi:hypothetical protein N7532_005776 [Penicillium argentinense]|uniref:chitinase n=1 Tax=Penicillium argentinense TaxID=1131581 RepID=A0A9W9KA92_9EURO|nr:uncharacterized protein N7532_005776 [Penicillium argentinense]KAJ5098775.1 hypothetical protein N7532_005776 [Penicillium argentinense]